MSAATVSVQQATIRQYAKRLQLATIAGQFVAMAEQAIKEKQGHLNYLEVLLGMEVEERERNTVARRIKEAHFPKVKTLEEFAFCDVPHIPVAVVRNLAEGGYLQRSEPIIFLGEAGTGKTHLATGLAAEACRQRKRVRFTTAAEMVNELIEAKNNNELNRVTQRWTRYELIVIDELAYVAMPETAAEMLFQIIAGRAERAAVIVSFVESCTSHGKSALNRLKSLAEGEPMGNLSGVVGHLKKELKRAQQEVQRFTAALAALGNSTTNGQRTLSAGARKRISLAQKTRWAKARKGSQPVATGSTIVKRTISAAGRKRIAAAQRVRWAKVKAAQKKAA
jgi:DNA replication protein DnaC